MTGIDEPLQNSTNRFTSAMCRPMVGSSRMNRLRLGQRSNSRALESGEQMADELDSLGFAAAESRAGLAELEVAQAGVGQGLQGALDFRHAGEEIQRFLNRKLEHLGDVFAAIFDVEVSRLKRQPSQTSQRTKAGGRKFISNLIVPAPSHSGQRP